MRRKIITAMILSALMISGAAAQSGSYAESDTVSDFNMTTAEIAIEHATVANEDVDVEFLHDDEVVDSATYTAGTTGNLNAVDLDQAQEIDQVRVYPDDTNTSEVGDLTVHYEYDGTSDRSSSGSYGSTQVFSGFMSDEGGGLDFSFGEIISLLLILGLAGAASDFI